jgi:hypothetical protein
LVWTGEGEAHKKAFPFSLGTRENAAMTNSRSAAEVHISLLGGFAITVSCEPVEDRWRLRKAKTLVKLLALAPGRTATSSSTSCGLMQSHPRHPTTCINSCTTSAA